MLFSRQATMQKGAAPHSWFMNDTNSTYNVTYEVFNATQGAQVRFQEIVNDYVTRHMECHMVGRQWGTNGCEERL